MYVISRDQLYDHLMVWMTTAFYSLQDKNMLLVEQCFLLRHLTLARWIWVCSPAVVVLSYLFVRDCIFVSLLCLCHFFNVNLCRKYILHIPQNCAIAWPRSYGRPVHNPCIQTNGFRHKTRKKAKSTFLVLIQKSAKHTWAITVSDQPCPVTPLTSLCTTCCIILGARAPGQAVK